jgi:hypothetical protein
MKYSHVFAIRFTAITDDVAGENITPEELRIAILTRLVALPDDELIEAVGCPEDTAEEDDG